MPKKRSRVFSRAFKLAAVRRMIAGEDVSALSRELRVLRKDLYYWRTRFRAGGPEALRGKPFATLRAFHLIARPVEALHYAIRVQAWRCIGLRWSLPVGQRRAFAEVPTLTRDVRCIKRQRCKRISLISQPGCRTLLTSASDDLAMAAIRIVVVLCVAFRVTTRYGRGLRSLGCRLHILVSQVAGGVSGDAA
jgi:transposase-like protein